MIRTLILSIFLVLATSLLIPGTAPGDNRGASVGLYLVDARGNCSGINPIGCSEDALVTGALFTPYYAVLAVFNGDPEEGIAGMECGIEYDSGTGSGVDVVEWNICADGLQFPYGDWPEPGTGNVITWSTCQENEPTNEGVTAIAGYFYVLAYSADLMEITKRPRPAGTEILNVANCAASETELDILTRAGTLGFSDDGSEEGKLPCVEKTSTTWGKIKNTYGN